jgi:hypothetical protein
LTGVAGAGGRVLDRRRLWSLAYHFSEIRDCMGAT